MVPIFSLRNAESKWLKHLFIIYPSYRNTGLIHLFWQSNLISSDRSSLPLYPVLKRPFIQGVPEVTQWVALKFRGPHPPPSQHELVTLSFHKPVSSEEIKLFYQMYHPCHLTGIESLKMSNAGRFFPKTNYSFIYSEMNHYFIYTLSKYIFPKYPSCNSFL